MSYHTVSCNDIAAGQRLYDTANHANLHSYQEILEDTSYDYDTMELALEGLNPNTVYNLDNIRYPSCGGDDPYGQNCGGELYDINKFY